MDSLLTLLSDHKRAGVYRSAIPASELIAAAKTVDLQVHRIDLAKAQDKNRLFAALAKAFRFPAHFGKNWDALNDCLTDLSWLADRGWLLVLSNGAVFESHHRSDFAMALEVLAAVAARWRDDSKPFWVIVQARPGWHVDLAEIKLV